MPAGSSSQTGAASSPTLPSNERGSIRCCGPLPIERPARQGWALLQSNSRFLTHTAAMEGRVSNPPLVHLRDPIEGGFKTRPYHSLQRRDRHSVSTTLRIEVLPSLVAVRALVNAPSNS